MLVRIYGLEKNQTNRNKYADTLKDSVVEVVEWRTEKSALSPWSYENKKFPFK